MKVGVTVRFQNSYFSGSIPQVSIAIAKALQIAGHDVTLFYPKGEASWFIDLEGYDAAPRKAWPPESSDPKLDTLIEVVWALPPHERLTAAKHVIGFIHHPPLFHDMESCVYSWNPTQRSFENLSALWTYDHYSKEDVQYLSFLSGAPVTQVPYVWNPDCIDLFLRQNSIPEWQESAKRVETMIPPGNPPTLSWCARIVESNFSNTSHCVIPLNIVSNIRSSGDPIRCTVHNGEQTYKSEFFKTNIAKNLLLPDISGNMVPRVRLPDLRREKTIFIAHQRFRPLKSFLLDALYMGIPMIHNCAMLKSMGAPYFYELNQIQQAIAAWKQCRSDYETSSGFFDPKRSAIRNSVLRSTFSPQSLSSKYGAALTTPMSLAKQPVLSLKPATPTELRVAFCEMWDQFQPKYNFFLLLLTWVGQQNGIRVVHDDVSPNLVFYGPYSNGGEAKYPGVPKVFFTGENLPPKKETDTFLNVGFNYDTSPEYLRLPLWVTEINWFGADPNKLVNPRPVSVKDATSVPSLDKKSKFCAFVATNPNNQNRNAAFQILNKWRPVDSGGRLFCNLPGGPIPAGLGGGGGELAKVEFYKDYKFVLTFENSSAPGYTTEKLFHAKVAGCVPIYWGDPFVDRDFDSKGFINANQVSDAKGLIDLVSKVSEDPEAWKAMASIPAVSEFKKLWCQRTMVDMANRIFQKVVLKTVKVESWAGAESFGATFGTSSATVPTPIPVTASSPTTPVSVQGSASSGVPPPRQFVTAANTQYAEAAINALASLNAYEREIPKIVYIWPDMPAQIRDILTRAGATELRELPIHTETPWADFWDPQHFAWKLWVHKDMLEKAPQNTCILYTDAGTVFSNPLTNLWNQIDTHGVLLLEDEEQTNERWCHPTFCKNLQMTAQEGKGQQLWAGGMGYKKGHASNTVAEEALTIAKTQRETIVGKKWEPYTQICMGHRHDQSILSLLTQRKGLARLPLRSAYHDRSMRSARKLGKQLYVHRGQYKDFVPFSDGIGEAHVINLARRPDRLSRFRSLHSNFQDRVYVAEAKDGRSLSLTKDLVHLFRNNDFKWKKSVMGCALSHLELWEQLAVDKHATSYFIMEDDVKLVPDWQVTWQRAVHQMPKDADVIYLGGVLPPNKAAFPSIIEPVNSYFARVAKNTLYGGPARRYFHFCNYAYVLTQQGALKLSTLVKEKGIFTSGDHMIVNHGDSLLNIYFTTPTLATCYQEEDPKYQASDFNNFNRVDGFDSDLWNNTECFTEAEIQVARADYTIPQLPPLSSLPSLPPLPASPPVSSRTTPPPTLEIVDEDVTKVWNTFLRQVALKETQALSATIRDIFSVWNQYTDADFIKEASKFQVFEQLILTNNTTLLPHRQQIFDEITKNPDERWNRILQHMGITAKERPTEVEHENENKNEKESCKQIYHMKEIQPNTMLEKDWLAYLYQVPLEFKELGDITSFLTTENPTLLYQRIPGRNISPVFDIYAKLAEQQQKQFSILHVSDEFGNDPIDFYANASVKSVVRMYWRPDLAKYGDKVKVIPLGYANGRHSKGSDTPAFQERPNLWAFAGSADRVGRMEALAILKTKGPYAEHTKADWSTQALLDGPAYTALMRSAKFVPCFKGSHALESFRLYEALEHGAIPVYVPSESPNGKDELTDLFGKHPFLGFPSWQAVADTIPKLAEKSEVMERHRASLSEWWLRKKAELRIQMKA